MAMEIGRWTGEGSVATRVLATPAAHRRARVRIARISTLPSEPSRRRWPGALRREGHAGPTSSPPRQSVCTLYWRTTWRARPGVDRGTQLPQCNSTHVPEDSGPTEGWGGAAPSRSFTCYVLKQPPSHFDPVLGRALNASRSTEGLSGCSAMEPMSLRTAGPTEGWGGAAPSGSFTCYRKESCILASKAWTSWYLSADGNGPSVRGASPV